MPWEFVSFSIIYHFVYIMSLPPKRLAPRGLFGRMPSKIFGLSVCPNCQLSRQELKRYPDEISPKRRDKSAFIK